MPIPNGPRSIKICLTSPHHFDAEDGDTSFFYLACVPLSYEIAESMLQRPMGHGWLVYFLDLIEVGSTSSPKYDIL